MPRPRAINGLLHLAFAFAVMGGPALTAADVKAVEISPPFSGNERKQLDALTTTAAKDKQAVTRRAALSFYLEVEDDSKPDRLVKTFTTLAGQDDTAIDACVMLAVSPRGPERIAALLKAAPTRRIAADAIATRAVASWLAQRLNARALAILPPPVDGKQSRVPQVRPMPGAPDDLTALLGDKDKQVAASALIAAAYAGGAELIPAADACPASGDVADACRLLLRARHKQPLAPEQVAAIAAAKVKGVVKDPAPSLSDGALEVPAQCILLDALAEAGDVAHVAAVDLLLGSSDMRVRMDACRAARVLASPTSVKPLIAALKDAEWPVLVEATYALGELAPVEAVEPLIAALKPMKGRFREDVLHALSSIVGDQGSRVTADEWTTWWAANKATFVPDPEKTKAYRAKTRVQDVYLPGHAAFYDLPIRSDRFSFVLDTSGSMKDKGKIEDLRQHATFAIGMLPNFVLLNVIDFGGNVSKLFTYEDLDNDLKAAKARIATMELSSAGTRSIDSMQAGLALKGADTLYFLSDGDPHSSQCDDWNLTCHLLALFTRHRPVAIHAISFHAGGANAQSMLRVACEHAGLSQSF